MHSIVVNDSSVSLSHAMLGFNGQPRTFSSHLWSSAAFGPLALALSSGATITKRPCEAFEAFQIRNPPIRSGLDRIYFIHSSIIYTHNYK